MLPPSLSPPRRFNFRTSLVAVEIIAAGIILAQELAGAIVGPWQEPLLLSADLVVIGAFAIRVALRMVERRGVAEPWALLAFAIALAAAPFSVRITVLVLLVHDAIAAYQGLSERRAGARALVRIGLHPARTLVVSFAVLIALGTFLLSLPAAVAGPRVALLDAFFTAVSATCVTGLTTVDTATVWSPFGLAVILALLQLGGLGVMAVAAAITLAFGRELGWRSDALVRGTFDESSVEELKGVLRSLVIGTLSIEAVGAALLLPVFADELAWSEAVGYALFHAVSAFCNGGFALYTDSVMRFAPSLYANVVFMVLIVLGGVGFSVLTVLGRLATGRERRVLPVHTRVVLVTSLTLIGSGALLYFLLEYDRSLAPLGFLDKIVAALFQSTSTRSAGFSSVDVTAVHPSTLLVMCALMFIGASPGSMGGGIKTTTFAIMVVAARALLRQQAHTEVFGRRVPQVQVVRALAFSGGAAVGLVLGLSALLLLESQPFEVLLFETVSALGTVGYSLGATPELSPAGRLVVCALMFVGRIGPLTVLAAAARRPYAAASITLPEGKILVG